jgi:cinnamyl-alcohol dehydrogenase
MSSFKPTAEEIKKNPREFALLTQVPGYESGSVKAEDLNRFAEKYGSGKANLKDGASFADVVAAFSKQGSQEGKGNTEGWAARDKSGKLSPYSFDRRPVGADDIRIQTTYAGICHTDLHQVKSEWADGIYPMVPGHEIIGVVTEVGSNVKNFKAGDRAGVGCFIDSCRQCHQCETKEDNYCAKQVATYNAKDWKHSDEVTYGGYSTNYVLDSNYAIKIPTNLDMSASAPLLCAGITTYSPLKYYKLDKPGMKLGVVGLGGLGHMAVKFGKALGLEVTVISTSEGKRKTAMELGAAHFLVSKDEKSMQEHAESLDGIIDTVSAQHDIAAELGLLKIDGKLIFVGVPPKPLEFATFSLIGKRRTIAGSMIGSIAETQEMIDYCAEKNITCDVEVIPIDYVNTAYERLAKNDVHYRFSIDVQGTLVQ